MFYLFVCPGLMCTPVFNPRLLHIKDGIPNAKRRWADTQGCKKLIQQVWLKQFQASSFPVQEGLTLRKPRWPSQALDAWGQPDFTHWQPWAELFLSLLSSLLRLQWTGRACPGEASAVVATCAPRSQWHHRHTGVRNAFKSLAALLPAQAFSREKG